MKSVVIGKSGLSRSRLVKKLRGDRHDSVTASPSSGVDTVVGGDLADFHIGVNGQSLAPGDPPRIDWQDDPR